MAVKTDPIGPLPTAQAFVFEPAGAQNRVLGQGIRDITDLALEEGTRIAADKFRDALNKNEQQFRNEVSALENEPIEDVVAQSLNVKNEDYNNLSPEVKQFVDLQARHEAAAQQGIFDPQTLVIRQENELRKAISRNPHLADEYLGVARNAGGFSVVSEDIKFRAAQAQQLANTRNDEIERLQSVSKELGVPQGLFTTNPPLYWEKTLQAMDRREQEAVLQRETNIRSNLGTMQLEETRPLVNKAMGGITAGFKTTAIMPILSLVTGVEDPSTISQMLKDNPIAIDELQLQLSQALVQEKAALRQRYDPLGQIAVDEWDKMLAPLDGMVESTMTNLTTGAVADRLDDYVSMAENAFTLALPNGPENLLVMDLLSQYSERGVIAAGGVARMRMNAYVPVLIDTLATGSSSYGLDLYDSTGAVRPNPRGTNVQDALIRSADGNTQTGQQSYIEMLGDVQRTLEQNAQTALQPGMSEAVQRQSVALATDFADRALKGLQDENLRESEGVMEGALNLFGSDAFYETFKNTAPEVQAAYLRKIDQVTQVEAEEILTQEIPQFLNKTLAAPSGIMREGAGEKVESTVFASPLTQGVIITASGTTTAVPVQDLLILDIDDSNGNVFFRIDDRARKDLSGAELNLITTTAADLNRSFSPQMTRLIRARSVKNPDRRNFRAEFDILTTFAKAAPGFGANFNTVNDVSSEREF